MHKTLETALATAEMLGRDISANPSVSPYDPLCGYSKRDLIFLVGAARVEQMIEEMTREVRAEMEGRLLEGDPSGVTCSISGGAHGVIIDFAEPLHPDDIGSRAYLVLVGHELKWVKSVWVRAPEATELEKMGESHTPTFRRGDRVSRNGELGVIVDEQGVGKGFFERRLVRWAYTSLEVEELAWTLDPN